MKWKKYCPLFYVQIQTPENVKELYFDTLSKIIKNPIKKCTLYSILLEIETYKSYYFNWNIHVLLT